MHATCCECARSGLLDIVEGVEAELGPGAHRAWGRFAAWTVGYWNIGDDGDSGGRRRLESADRPDVLRVRGDCRQYQQKLRHLEGGALLRSPQFAGFYGRVHSKRRIQHAWGPSAPKSWHSGSLLPVKSVRSPAFTHVTLPQASRPHSSIECSDFISSCFILAYFHLILCSAEPCTISWRD